ncbi:MAG: hypothetical protein ABFS02_05650 [Pseudomonadota bacterium]
MDTGRFRADGEECESRSEWFMRSTLQAGQVGPSETVGSIGTQVPALPEPVRFRQPGNGLHLAMDPRIPPDKQAFEFVVQGVRSTDSVHWRLDGDTLAWTTGARHRWQLVRGSHHLSATIWREKTKLAELGPVGFVVK